MILIFMWKALSLNEKNYETNFELVSNLCVKLSIYVENSFSLREKLCLGLQQLVASAYS